MLQAIEAEPVMMANDEGLYVAQGLSASIAESLVEKSREDFTNNWAPQDAEIHFTCAEQIRWWNRVSAGKPLIVSLGTAAGDLAGIAWITNIGQVNKKEGRKLEVRVYDNYRQQKVGTALGNLILDKYAQKHAARTKVEIDPKNQPGFGLAVNLGYRTADLSAKSIELVR